MWYFNSWCNGNTTSFGGVIRGSSPCELTNKIYRSLKIVVEFYLQTKNIKSKFAFKFNQTVDSTLGSFFIFMANFLF